MNVISLCFLSIVILHYSCADKPCNLRKTGWWEEYVCVCNVTYCDTIPRLEKLPQGQYVLFVSNKKGNRVHRSEGRFQKDAFDLIPSVIKIDRKRTYQTIRGFGTAFTDSAGINLASLPVKLQWDLIEAYFSENGSEYSMGRVPIGGTDFSPRPYTYQDDPKKTFALQEEDFKYKIPYIKMATNVSKNAIELIASPWSSPAWTKTNNAFNHGGFLKKEYYNYWAEYFVKFFEAYKKEGIRFWGVTVQNEPATGLAKSNINSIAWFPSQLMTFIKNNLGPALHNSSLPDLQIIIHDDQRLTISAVREYYEDPEVLKYISCVAVHWYFDKIVPPEALQWYKTDKKDICLITTEACEGFKSKLHIEKAVSLGEWRRGMTYAKYIIQDLQQGAVGWIDWNMALNMEGGPQWVKNPVDSAIIVNADKQEFYKQPQYYAMLHFSKFIPRGSKQIKSSSSLFTNFPFSGSISHVAFLRPDAGITLAILNWGGKRKVKLHDENRGSVILKLTPYSINTLIYY